MLSKDRYRSLYGKLPLGTVSLFFIQIFSTLSFSVLYSTLVLYMTSELGLSTTLANSITGVFVAFNFALHLLGGYWGGRYFSYRALFCLGMVAQILGCLILATNQMAYLYLGLGAFLTGSGLNVTCINCMVTQQFPATDTRRETAFLYNYAGMNLGFFLGFTLSGYFQIVHNYPRLFVLSSVGNVIALVICSLNFSKLADSDTVYARLRPQERQRHWVMGLCLIALMPWTLGQFLQSSSFSNKMVLLIGCVMFVVACVLASRQQTEQARRKLYAFSALMIISIVFRMLYQIGPMGLIQFIAHNVSRQQGSFIIPPQWFHNINTICIVIGGPALSIIFNRLRERGINVNVPMQFVWALIFIGLAFAILPIGIRYADAQGFINPSWMVLCFVLQSIGELLISPIGYAMVGALVPKSLQGVMMGITMLSNGVGAALASYCSNWMTEGVEGVDPLLTNAGYGQGFLRLGLLAIAAGLLLWLFVPRLKRWTLEACDVQAANDSHLNTDKHALLES